MATTVTIKPNAIDLSGSTSGTTTLQATAVAGTTTLTLPAATDTLVGKATIDTLTNKTLTGAVMNGTVGATTPSTGAFTTLSATGVTTVQAGTAALPAITTSGDTNTGIFFPAADTIAFTEGGAESMRIDSSGNVGIGTSSPATKLEVSGSMTASNYLISVAAATYGKASDTSIEMATSADATPRILFRVGSASEAMRIDSSGNVGIGTSSPNASAILDAQSTTKGVRMPNMTTTQKNAISSPAAGLMVFDTTLAKLCVYSGSAWQTITSV